MNHVILVTGSLSAKISKKIKEENHVIITFIHSVVQFCETIRANLIDSGFELMLLLILSASNCILEPVKEHVIG